MPLCCRALIPRDGCDTNAHIVALCNVWAACNNVMVVFLPCSQEQLHLQKLCQEAFVMLAGCVTTELFWLQMPLPSFEHEVISMESGKKGDFFECWEYGKVIVKEVTFIIVMRIKVSTKHRKICMAAGSNRTIRGSCQEGMKVCHGVWAS